MPPRPAIREGRDAGLPGIASELASGVRRPSDAVKRKDQELEASRLGATRLGIVAGRVSAPRPVVGPYGSRSAAQAAHDFASEREVRVFENSAGRGVGPRDNHQRL